MCAAQSTWQSHKRDFDGFINGIPIRKVYFAPALPQIAEHIERYFQGFGAVESISVHDEGRLRFGLIQYSTIEAAKAVLSIPEHRVASIRLTVKPANELHQPDYMKFKAPEQDSPHHIHNALIDDCLERVFKQFDLVDLAIAADVCVRFQLHAIDAFETKYKGVVTTKSIPDEYGYESSELPFEMILRNFGSLIHSLTIDRSIRLDHSIDTLKMVDKYAPALKHLKLDHFHFWDDESDVHPLFAKLEKMELLNCDCVPSELFASCLELKCVRIGGVLWKDCIDIYHDNFMDGDWFQGLGRLSLLKKLKLRCNGESITSLLNELVENAIPLEYLSLKEGSADSNAIKNMCKLTKLKRIGLKNIRGLTDDHCIELAKKLPHLHTLHLRGSTAEHITTEGLRTMLGHTKMLSKLVLKRTTNIRSINMNVYSSMLKSVQDRSEKIKLEIKITGDGSKVDVPEDVLLANREWLWIDEEVETDNYS